MDNKNNKEQFMKPLYGNKFQFSCHQGVPCFTDCCRDLRLVLTPYDIIRMKNRLGLSAKEFLDKYTFSEFDRTIGFPVVLLKMRNDEKKSCPFVSSKGCLIYEDRPGACRIYPLGRATQKGASEEELKEKYFIIKEPHCLGFREKKIWTIEEWLKDQGVDKYNEMNDYWTEVTTSRNPKRYQGLDEKKLQMFYLASYNLDSFKEFIFSSNFLKLFEIDQKTQEKICNDEVELMKFGCRWMKFSLFGEPTIKIKPEIIQVKKGQLNMR
ncbi:MAG: YkgJ family cysteine cluster protein [Candidatus Aminicenantes bacterium]|nr:MAG: YkgJ family cysteine cluster protein [Candidatus Aminicenantes bacterium]